jgi:hypothetical protein
MIFLSISLFGQKERFVNDFKIVKKNTDSLFLMPVFVKIDALWNQHSNIDKETTDKVYDQLYNKLKSLLNKKYILFEDSSDFDFSESALSEMDNLRLLLYEMKNPISKVEIPGSIDSMIKTCNRNIFLLVGLSGYYTEEISPYQKATGNYMYIGPTAFASMTISLFLLDKKRNEIIYFNEDFVKDDPRIPELVDRIILKAIKPIYYK